MKINRFNDYYVLGDLEEFLKAEITNGREGSYSGVTQWISEYKKGIEEYVASVIKRFEEICQGAVVQMKCYSPEGDPCDPCDLGVFIYGIEYTSSMEDVLYDLRLLIEEEVKSRYHLAPYLKR